MAYSGGGKAGIQRLTTKRSAEQRQSFLEDFAEHFAHELTLSTRVRFPSPVYRNDPVAFFRTILGVEPWHKQLEIIHAVRDYPRVAVSSGHKVSKSHTAAGLALWYFCSFPDARVVMTSTTSRQVDQILWRELRMLRARAGRCLACKTEDPDGLVLRAPCEHSSLIDGEQHELARSGLKSADFREVVGFTAKEPEAVAGVSGRHLLYLIDEASGVAQEIFDAIEGNRAGGAKLVMFSNPTRNEGEFFEAFYQKQQFYKTIRISSEDSPNVKARKVVIPGLATWEWVKEKREEWGPDSPLYKVRVKGEHALSEEGRIFSVHAIGQSEARWADTKEAGRLYVGLDPAGESGLSDDTVFVARRGLKLLEMHTHIGMDAAAHLTALLHLLARLRVPREVPVVVVDRDGTVGSKVHGLMGAHAMQHPEDFELVGVRASDAAVRMPHVYDRMRDELAGNFEAWIREGGAILEDTRLAKQLHALEWRQTVKGKVKLISKDVLRKLLGRSPDHYDAAALSCWEPLYLRAEDAPASVQHLAAESEEDFEHVLDPYAALDQWRR